MNLLKENVMAPVLIGLVATSGLLLAFQGWNTRMFDFDLIPYFYDVRALLDFGTIPNKGTLTSFGSYTPPGITWLMLPGAFLFNDPRLYELPGCALLYTGTLI